MVDRFMVYGLWNEWFDSGCKRHLRVVYGVLMTVCSNLVLWIGVW